LHAAPGLELALISGENSPLVDRYAEKMHIGHIMKGRRDKATALREFAGRSRIELAEICYMGDDVNDLPAIEIAGFSAARPTRRGAFWPEQISLQEALAATVRSVS